MTRVMARSTAAAGRVNKPSTSNTGVVSSIVAAIYAATSGGSNGTLYSSTNSATAVSQFASLVMAEFQNTVARASRNGIARAVYGTPSSQCRTRLISASAGERGDVVTTGAFIGHPPIAASRQAPSR